MFMCFGTYPRDEVPTSEHRYHAKGPERTKKLSGGVQQVRVVLRVLALFQLAKGVSAPQIAT
jgi:hypothetical protein